MQRSRSLAGGKLNWCMKLCCWIQWAKGKALVASGSSSVHSLRCVNRRWTSKSLSEFTYWLLSCIAIIWMWAIAFCWAFCARLKLHILYFDSSCCSTMGDWKHVNAVCVCVCGMRVCMCVACVCVCVWRTGFKNLSHFLSAVLDVDGGEIEDSTRVPCATMALLLPNACSKYGRTVQVRSLRTLSSSVIQNEGQNNYSMCKGLVQGKRGACVQSSDFRYNNIRWKIRQVMHNFVQGT